MIFIRHSHAEPAATHPMPDWIPAAMLPAATPPAVKPTAPSAKGEDHTAGDRGCCLCGFIKITIFKQFHFFL